MHRRRGPAGAGTVIVLRGLARLIGMLLMFALALVCLGIAMYCLNGLISLGSIRPDRLLHLPTVRRHVGHFLAQIAAPGPTADLALAGGVVSVCLGLLVVGGTLRSTRQRLILLRSDRRQGTLAARPRTLRAMAQALAEQAAGVTAIKRPTLTSSRRGTRGRLSISVSRSRGSDPREVQAAVATQLELITGPFGLRPRVKVREGEAGERVQ
jgi:hypothetical protein